MERVLEQINGDLAPLGYEVRSCVDEQSEALQLVVVNTKANAFAELATPYSPAELAYVKMVIQAIFHAPDAQFSVASNAALQLASQMQPTPMTKRAASDLLESLQLRRWLTLSRRTGRYALTVRALNELDMYLRSEFEEQVYECRSCYELVTIGWRCSAVGCRGALHRTCAARSHAAEEGCPACKAAWTPLPIGDGGTEMTGAASAA